MSRTDSPDIVIAGGGLAASLVALRLAGAARVLMVDPAPEPLSGHTWCFHDPDVAAEDRAWLAPAVGHRWPDQEVRFPAYTRRIATGYASVTPDSLSAALPESTARRTGRVAALDAGGVTLEDGARIEAGLVVDARGFSRDPALDLGFQKFLGLTIETERPHGVERPVIMDAAVPQMDGYRFVYLLPFSPTRLLIEDTRYADGAALSAEALRADLAAEIEARGWTVTVLAEERGVLPIALGFDARAFWSRIPRGQPTIGMRAGRFHPLTGYSLPDAVCAASTIARHWRDGPDALDARLRADAVAAAGDQAFYRLLTRMLFRAAGPGERWRVLERFYRLPRPLIERFYAGRTTWADRARILVGRPPVPVTRALRCLGERRDKGREARILDA